MKYNKSTKLEDICKIDIEIGDFKQVDFYPQVKFKHWDNECNFSLRFTSDIKESSYNQSNDEIIWEGSNNILVRMYEKINLPISNEEGFEFEFELPNKPKSNIFEMTIQTKGLEFLYQPELTQDEIDRGDIRPDNVVGSYAVYHDSKTDNEYKTGKAFHIYRPEAIDKDGNKTWCELDIDVDNEILTITVPQKFLDDAVYPVIVDPTFGYTTVGATQTDMAIGHMVNYFVSAPASVSVDSISVYGMGLYESSGTRLKGIIWGGGSLPAAIITNGITPQFLATRDVAAWYTGTYSTKPSVTASTNYRVGIIQGGSTFKAYYDSGSAPENNNINYGTNNYDSPPSWPNVSNTNAGRYSVYATYSTSPEPSGSIGSFDCWWSSQFKESYHILSVSGSLVAIANSKNDNKPFRLLSRSGTSLSGDFVIETSVYRKAGATPFHIQGISIFATSADVNNFGELFDGFNDKTSGCVVRMGVFYDDSVIRGSWNDYGLTALTSDFDFPSDIIGLRLERRDGSISAFYKDGSSSWQIAPNLNQPYGYVNYSDNVYVVVEGNGYESFDYFRIAAESGLPNNWVTSSVSSTSSFTVTSGSPATVVASATSNIIGSTIYLSAENVSAWQDTFNYNDYSATNSSYYKLNLTDSVFTNFIRENNTYFSACEPTINNCTFNNTIAQISANFS